VPDYWNIFEPITIPFCQTELTKVIAALVPASPSIGSGVFLVREGHPRFLLTISLRLAAFQGTTPHNTIRFDECAASEKTLTHYLPRCVLPAYPDYASIPTWEKDKDRYKEFDRSYSPKEFAEMFTKKQTIKAPFGPYGCLADVQWFNYFGRVYVEAIGKARLMGAGWEHVEEIGDGLACYATKSINDANSRERRSSIATAIAEFVWTPGCKPDQKRIPDFDFSEQLAALPDDAAKKANQSSAFSNLHFAGLSDKEQEEAMRLLQRGGTSDDPKTGKEIGDVRGYPEHP
jgi:hypothetical protein